MKKRVLVIEDDVFLQNLEVSNLEKNGFEVVPVSTGEEAMKKIHEPNIDIILLDIVLPDFDGFEILKKIKTDKLIKNIPVIIFSNLSDEKDIEKGRELGANEFLVKSNFTLGELIQKINIILKKNK
jgi:two-component system, OmpR family, alkaline phosphatase synthesis response regulator PhoP